MINQRSFAALFLVVAGVVCARAQSAAPAAGSPEALARSLQQHYNGITDFKASFEQTSRGGVLRATKAEGMVAVKKPGRMRWDYEKPDKSQIVSDGARVYTCYLETKEWQCDDPVAMPKESEAPSVTLFLLGRGDILRDFRVSRVQSPVRDTVALRLDPRKPDPDFEYLIVSFDPMTYQIRGLTNRNREGSESTIVLSDIKVNTNISDKTFTPPAGARKRPVSAPGTQGR
jgi:outer membrane lipoprotein carrier protein